MRARSIDVRAVAKSHGWLLGLAFAGACSCGHDSVPMASRDAGHVHPIVPVDAGVDAWTPDMPRRIETPAGGVLSVDDDKPPNILLSTDIIVHSVAIDSYLGHTEITRGIWEFAPGDLAPPGGYVVRRATLVVEIHQEEWGTDPLLWSWYAGDGHLRGPDFDAPATPWFTSPAQTSGSGVVTLDQDATDRVTSALASNAALGVRVAVDPEWVGGIPSSHRAWIASVVMVVEFEPAP